MGYVYAEQRDRLFTEAGVDDMLAVRKKIDVMLASSGAVQAARLMDATVGDSWFVLAVLDFMLERKELIEYWPMYEGKAQEPWGQHRVFTRPLS